MLKTDKTKAQVELLRVDDTEGKINLNRKERIKDASKKNVILKQNKKTIFD